MHQHFHSHTYDIKRMCLQYQHHYVQVKTDDNQEYEGFIEHVDDDHLYILMPIRNDDLFMEQAQSHQMQEERQFYPGSYPGYGYGYQYPFYPGYRRFILPFAALTTLALLPYSYYW